MSTYTLSWTGTEIDDQVLAYEFSHAEGEFAMLRVDIKNPRIGLLSLDLFATLSRDGVPIFHGRVVGLPTDLHLNVIQVSFLACPDTYDADKAAFAETLKVAPFWDPVFIAPDQRSNPDMVLEARPALWHIDPVTHAVSVSDILTGEAGIVEIDTHPYDSLRVAFGEAPADTITCTAEIHWKQYARGTLNLTAAIKAAFINANSVHNNRPASYTGGGLMSDWPKTGTNIGAGWKVGESKAWRVDGIEGDSLNLNVGVATGGLKANTGLTGFTSINWLSRLGGLPAMYTDGSNDWYNELMYYGDAPDGGTQGDPTEVGEPTITQFPIWAFRQSTKVDYDIERDRKEIVTFTMTADVQSIVTSRADHALDVKLTTAEVDEPVDAGGALPIGDVRRNSYMLTDRGHQSLEYLIILCRSRLLAKARAVRVSVELPMADAVALSLKHSVTILDPRLPGGQATGKVVARTLALDGSSGAEAASLTLACTIGKGNTTSAPAGSADYAEDGYVASGYQVYTGSGADLVSGDIWYADYSGTEVAADEIDLTDVRAADAVLSCVVVNGLAEQEALLLAGPEGGGQWADTSAAIAALNENPTQVALSLRPLTHDGPLETAFPITVSGLMIPKTIDLEAASA